MRIGWFSTGRDEAARALLSEVMKEIALGSIKAEIAFVFCNREWDESRETKLFLDLSQGYKLPLITFSSQRFLPELRQEGLQRGEGSAILNEWRLAYDREVMEQLDKYNHDIDILAGYMLIVGPEMCNRYIMINLHPAAPGGPPGTWQQVIWQLIYERAKRTGITIHLVTPELDRGPAVAFCTFPIIGKRFDSLWKEIGDERIEAIQESIYGKMLFTLIRENGVARELPMIVMTIKALADGKLQIEGQKTIGLHGDIINGYDLTQEIEDITIKKDVRS